MGRHRKTQHVNASCIPPNNNITAIVPYFFETVKNVFLGDDSKYQFLLQGDNVFLSSMLYRDLITKMSCIMSVANYLFNLRARTLSGSLIQMSLWKKYQVVITSQAELKFNIKTAGLEILRIIPKQEKFQQKKLKIGTFNIFYYFFDALSNPDLIENDVLRNHLKELLKMDSKNIILGPKYLNTEAGIKEFNQFCNYLTLLGIDNKKLCDLFDILYNCLLLGCQLDDVSIKSPIGQLQQNMINELYSVEPKQHAKMPLQTQDRVRGMIILMYQMFCDTILNQFQKHEENCMSQIQVIEKADCFKNERKTSFDLSFVEFVSNYIYLAVEKPPNSVIILDVLQGLFSKNKPWDKAALKKEFKFSSYTTQIRLPWIDEELWYDFEDVNLNSFFLNSNIQIYLQNSKNQILRNLKMVDDCQTKTLMFYVFEKVKFFQDLKSTLQFVMPRQPPFVYNSGGSEVFLNTSVINSNGSQLQRSTESNKRDVQYHQQTDTQLHIKRSIKNYNQSLTIEEAQMKKESEIEEKNSQKFPSGEINYQQEDYLQYQND